MHSCLFRAALVVLAATTVVAQSNTLKTPSQLTETAPAVYRAGDPDVQRAWQAAGGLRDEPPMKSNMRGYVSFTKENLPNTRFTQVFINYADNSYLDEQGFAPFGQVVTGMAIADKLFAYGRENEPDQRAILREGNAYLQKEFPKLDYVKKASIAPAAAPAPRVRQRPS